jgi:hypothetical protein
MTSRMGLFLRKIIAKDEKLLPSQQFHLRQHDDHAINRPRSAAFRHSNPSSAC